MNNRLMVLCAVGLAGCIVEAPSGDRASSLERGRAVVSQVPPVTVRSGANFGGKIELLGATIQPGQIPAGDRARATLYFQVLEEMDQDYMVFVHVEDVDRQGLVNVDHAPAGGYSTRQWKKGEKVKDEFFLPAGAATRAVNVYLGFWHPASDTRLPIRNPEAVRHDGANRLLLATVQVAP